LNFYILYYFTDSESVL